MRTSVLEINFYGQTLRVWPPFLCGISLPPYFFQEETYYVHVLGCYSFPVSILCQ